MTKTLDQRVAALEARINTLESARPGRKAKPMIVLREKGVCAIDPDRDSSKCPDASIFRYQSGCHGTACLTEQHNAYLRRKNSKAIVQAKTAKKVARPTRKRQTA